MSKLAVVGLSAIVALFISACGLPGTDDPGSPSSAPPPPTASSGPSASTDSSSTQPSPFDGASTVAPTPADPSQPSGDEQLGEVVVTRTSASDGVKIVMKLYPVLREGTTSHLNLTLSTSDDRVSVNRLLSDGDSSSGDKSSYTADGLQLVDGKNSKLYLVASDGEGQCLCSRVQNVSLAKGAPVLFSATFAAPPADVTSVDVRIPTFGTVRNVPVQ